MITCREKTEEALRREVRDAFFNPTLGLHRSVDILDHPNVRKAFDALRDHYQARKHVWVSCGNGGECDVCKCAHDERAPQTCPGPGTIQSGLMVPPVPSGCSLFAVNCKTGAWHYVNHADTWQGMPNPLTQARPTFEGDEAPMINEQKVRYLLRSSGTELDRQALALLDAKDVEIARLKSKLADVEASEMGLLSNANAYHARAEQAEAALAERDAAIAGLMDCLIETVGTPRVEALHGKRLDAAYDAAKTFLPAPEPAVDPLVAVLEAAGYAVFPEDLERVRAAIERAGGVKAVFGEGGE